MDVLVLCDNKEVFERVSPIFFKRKDHHFTITDSDSINPRVDFVHIIKTYQLVFSVHCKKIFPKILLESVKCINCHPGFSPFNRGIFPHVFSIVNGLPAGVTIHEMTSEVDLGPSIFQWAIDVKSNDTSGSLYKKIIDLEMNVLDLHLDILIDGNYSKLEHKTAGNYNSMDDFKRLCDFSNVTDTNFTALFARLRALSHPGYMNAHYNGIKFKLIIDENNHPSKND